MVSHHGCCFCWRQRSTGGMRAHSDASEVRTWLMARLGGCIRKVSVIGAGEGGFCKVRDVVE